MQCPQSQQLQQMLDETLPADQQAALQAHLESCAACQKTLERFAAGGVTWDKMARNLGDKPSPNETALLDAVEKLQETPTSPLQTQAEAPAGPVDEDLTFLQPPQRPGSLGRLDEFEILAVVGKGGFGIVLKAFDETLHRVVAIKVMAPQMAVSATARQRFTKEAKAAAAITHENVVTIHAVGKDPKVPYLVMQFVSGITLSEKIDKCGALGIKEVLRIGMQIAEGLAAAHKQGLVHRDIKPGNVLLENGVERVKITDFGLARAADDASLTQSGTVAGTPMFMSPEQANGEHVDHRSDLFSLGSVLYVMCTGRPPFRASTTMAVLKRVCDDTPTPVQQVNTDMPAWLGNIIAKLQAKMPANRYPTAREVADLLGQRLADLQAGRVSSSNEVKATVTMPAPVASAAPPAVAAPKRRSRLRVWVASILAAVCIMLAVRLGMHLLGLAPWRPFGDVKSVESVANPPFAPVFGGAGWRSLYDGKGYTGWKTFGDSNAGRGELLLFPGAALETTDKMPRNFHLRMEVNLVRGQGAVRFHTSPLQDGKDSADGWDLTFTENAEGKVNGGLDIVDPADAKASKALPAPGIAKCGDWFYLEIIAKDDATEVFVNGHKQVTSGHSGHAPTAGVLRLMNSGQRGRAPRGDAQIAFRNIEIKDTTPANVPEAGWVQLIHGNDMEGWRPHTGRPGLWRIADGVITCAGVEDQDSWLYTDRANYQNFEFKLEFKVEMGSAALAARSEFAMAKKKRKGIDFLIPDDIPDYKVPPGYLVNLSGPAGEWSKAEVACVGRKRTVKINGKLVEEADDTTLLHHNGRFVLRVAGEEALVRFRNIQVKELPASGPIWVHLFDGKGLDGWFTEKPDAWSVRDGVIVGKSDAAALLLTNRADFADFHLRVEAKVNAVGNSGLWFRMDRDYPHGSYKAQINVGHDDPNRTGSLIVGHGEKKFDNVVVQKKSPVPADTWFLLEVSAIGPDLVVKVNGQTTAIHRDFAHRRGRIALELYGPNCVAHFRKLEIKELPTVAMPPAPKLARWGDIVNPKDASTIKDMNGRLHVTVPASLAHLHPKIDLSAPRVLQDVDGDFNVEVQLFASSFPRDDKKPGYVGEGLLLWQDEGNFLTFERGFNESGKALLNYLFVEEGIDRNTPATSGPPTVIHLRMERKGPVIRAYWSGDGKNWKEHFSIPKSKFASKVKVGVVVVNASGVPYQTAFENLRLTRPTESDWAQLTLQKDLLGKNNEFAMWRDEGDSIRALSVTGQKTGNLQEFTFLQTNRKYRNFDLKFDIRLKNKNDVRGLFFRSRLQDAGTSKGPAGKPFLKRTAVGPQVLMGANQWGHLAMDGPRTARPLKFAAVAVRDAVKIDDFNEIHVRCVGKKATIAVNGVIAQDSVELEMLDEGLLAWYHEGFDGEVTLRNIRIKELPDSSGPTNLAFDGATSYVDLPGLAVDLKKPFTVELYVWAEQPKLPTQYILFGNTLSLALNGERWQFVAGNEGPCQIFSDQPAKVGQWVHLAAVGTDDKRDLFIDGKLQKNTVLTKIPKTSYVPGFNLGGIVTLGNKQRQMFQGRIREVRFSQSARYLASFKPAPRFEPDADTMALYHCDEGQGDVLTDSSANKLHGKIVGAKWVKFDAPKQSARAERGVLDFTEIHDADAKAFDTWVAKLQRDGFCPVSLSVRTVNDAPRFTAVAVKEEKKKVWEVAHVPCDAIEHMNQMWAKKYVSIAQAIYREQDVRKDAIVWVWNPKASNGMWGGDKPYEAEIAARKAQGFRPHTAVAHDNDAGELRFSVIWIRYLEAK